MGAGDAGQRLVGQQRRLNIKVPQPLNASRRAFNPLRIGDAPPQHLVAAAQPQHEPTTAQMGQKVDVPALPPQRREVRNR